MHPKSYPVSWHLSWLLLALGVGASHTHAAPEPNVTGVQFRVLSLTSAFSGVTYKDGSKYTELKTGSSSVAGTFYSYTGPNPLVLYRGQPVNPTTPPPQVGRVTFSAQATGRFLVILTGDPQTGVNGVAVPDSVGTFPARHLRVVNATGLPIVVTCNQDPPVTMRSGDFKNFNLGTGIRGDVSVGVVRNNETIELASNIYSNGVNMRRSVFVILTNSAELAKDPTVMPMLDMLSLPEAGNPPSGR